MTPRIKKITKIIKSKKLEADFKPSMKILSRIMKVMTKNGSKGKTQLSLETRINYARLAKHIVWLEKNGLVESKIKDGKINVVLTTSGREFASMISKTK